MLCRRISGFQQVCEVVFILGQIFRLVADLFEYIQCRVKIPGRKHNLGKLRYILDKQPDCCACQ